MNTKNKSQIEVKSIQYKERSYYEWGSNMQIVRKGNGEIAMTEGELARFFGVTWRKLNNRLQEIIHNPNLYPDERSAGERVIVRDNELVGYDRFTPSQSSLPCPFSWIAQKPISSESISSMSYNDRPQP